MELSKKNWFAIYYKWMNYEYPKDICSFFWGTLLIVLLFPIMIPGRLIYRYASTGEMIFYGTLVWIVYAISIIIGAETYANWINVEFKGNFNFLNLSLVGIFLGLPLVFLLVVLTIILGIGIVVGICWGIHQLYKLLKTNKPKNENKKHFIAAVKGKYCTPIIWK